MHKYTNTASVKVAHRHNMCYIFAKVMVQGPQKQCSQVSDVQIHKNKYTNTKTKKNKYTNTNTQVQIPKYKYTNTNIQIHKYINT